MSSSHPHDESASFCRTIWIASVVLLGAVSAFAASVPNGAPARDLKQPIVTATSESFFPYQFRDRDGELKGFANDISDAIARAVNLQIRRVPIVNTSMAEALRSGRVDVIQFWSETAERRLWADFSVPIVRFETVVVVRKGTNTIRQLADLKGKRVAVGQVGTIGHKYLKTEHPEATPVFTETSEEFLRMLAQGQVDAAVMSRLTAVSMIDRFGLRNLKVLDDRIVDDSYDVRYCYTVRRGDSLLLARLNEGLAIIHRTGEFDTIYHRWFGRYEKRTFSPLELLSYVAAALALACAAVTWGFVRQRTLSRHVARQAAELAEQRSLLAAVYEKHPLATVIIEVPATRPIVLVSANAEAVRLMGLNPAQPLPDTIDRVELASGIRVHFDDAVSRWQAAGGACHWELKLPGTQRLVEAAVVPLGRTEKGGHRICLFANDVTQRRLMDNELAQSRRLRALGELVGGIAHEFNNLLTPIIVTTSQAQSQRALAPSIQADFIVIDNAARRAAELTRRLLTFGRKTDERRQAVHLAETVENCFALLRSTVDRRVVWTVRAAPNLPLLWLNPTDLNQIVFNLVINARDTLLEKLAQPHAENWLPRLTAIVDAGEGPPPDAVADGSNGLPAKPAHAATEPTSASTSPRAVDEPDAVMTTWQRLTVEDNGLGIAPEIADRIFEPFFTTKETGRGTGLGLATVWHLVNELGGSVSVSSQAGEGSRFHVTFPSGPEDAAPGVTPETEPNSKSVLRGLRVLLAEDDPDVARAALVVLERAAYTVRHFADGADAWSHLALHSASYDVLLLDLNMPRLNGIDLIRRVRRSPFSGTIVVMSGRITDEERQVLAGLHVDRVLPKPFSALELVQALRGLGSANRPVNR